MSLRFRNDPSSRILISLAALLLLAACTMPEEPDGANVEGLTRIGDQLHARGDDAGAADFYQRSLQRDKTDQKARKGLAEILEAHGDYAGAADQYRTALALDPDNADFIRALGRVLLKEGRGAEAKETYEKALQLDSSDIKALNGLGIALDYMGQHSAAQKVYKEARDDDPDDLVTLNNLANSYILSGGYDEAIQILEPHVHDKSATPALRQNLALAYGMTGMEADAERVARMDLSPDQVKRNLDYYRAQRTKLAVVPKFYASLGSFATEAMAQGRVLDIQDKFPKETEGLLIAARPEVKTIGGTPVFTVQVEGFQTAAKLQAFCDKLKKGGIACKTQVGM